MTRRILIVAAAVAATAAVGVGGLAVAQDGAPIRQAAAAAEKAVKPKPLTPSQRAEKAVRADFERGMTAMVEGRGSCVSYVTDEVKLGLAFLGGCKGVSEMIEDEADRRGVDVELSALDDAKIAVASDLRHATIVNSLDGKPSTTRMVKGKDRWLIDGDK